jgi:alpha-galactosidase
MRRLCQRLLARQQLDEGDFCQRLDRSSSGFGGWGLLPNYSPTAPNFNLLLRDVCTKMSLPAFLALVVGASTAAAAANRGWNSWDNFLGNSNESQTLAIASYMQQNLLNFGFDLVTIDEGWYYDGSPPGGITLDKYGRPVPTPAEYPSASTGGGFQQISTQVHALGLRFGVWTIRGIPAAAANARLPIANSPFTADQAVRYDRNCSWNGYCLGCADAPDGSGCNAAAQAYYNSLADWYKEQGIDLVKVRDFRSNALAR